MALLPTDPPECPRCGGATVKLCGQSVQYGPAESPDQPLQARELQTLAYQCDCGMAFTQTVRRVSDPRAEVP
jgi:hypothetical protein